eukprot:TRINITY_DN2205_c0_g1_i2.p1 TRINITY_DN2205_c0_g1~~TRINITY_DN2205_c0_g1_i2.p1  ORF type:complete len:432 (-),score=91.01 TRINITY_DN2205_c0_g1_i2:298-1533(-)
MSSIRVFEGFCQKNLFAKNIPFLPNGLSVRKFSAQPPHSAQKMDLSRLEVLLRGERQKQPELKSLQFGKVFSDHMFQIQWNSKDGWFKPRILPYSQISIYPSAAALHYGLECFEGMKAYKDASGEVRLFRPDKNIERFQTSSTRLTLPTFDNNELLEAIKRLVDIDRDWVPAQRGYSLYIRPFAICTQPELGVSPVHESSLIILCSPVGPYYPEGFKPVSLYADSLNVRAAPGGVGSFKVGANYGPTVFLQKQAAGLGFSQVLWLYNDLITEVGTMNFFMFWVNEKGEKELMTPPLTEGTILPRVTRLSILELARQWNQFKVSERNLKIQDLIKAIHEKRVIECFGAGTAAIVCPIKGIHFEGKDYSIPLDPQNSSATVGPLTQKFADTIMAIQYGEMEHTWSVKVDRFQY